MVNKATRGMILFIIGNTPFTLLSVERGNRLRGFFESLRIEIAQHGVSVTMLFPDFVQTGTRLQAFGTDGKLVERDTKRKGNVMHVDEAARVILDAVAKRKRELIMSRRGRLASWVKVIAPGLIDRIAKKTVEREN